MVKNVGIEGGLLNVCDIGYNDWWLIIVRRINMNRVIRVIKKVIVKYCYVIWKFDKYFFWYMYLVGLVIRKELMKLYVIKIYFFWYNSFVG